MPHEYYVLTIGYIFGFYMAWNIGANDVANSMASSVGAKAITIRQAIFIAGVLNILGAVFIGSHVTNTIRKGIVSTEVLTDPHLALIGALSALLAAALWVSFATWKSLPVSTTHSIVGAMIGFGIMAGGFSVINWAKLAAVVMSWVISPVFSIIIAFLMFKIIVKLILSQDDTFTRSLKLSPFFIGATFFVVVLSFLFKTPLGKKLALGPYAAFLVASIMAFFFGLAGMNALKWFVKRREGGAEAIFFISGVILGGNSTYASRPNTIRPASSVSSISSSDSAMKLSTLWTSLFGMLLETSRANITQSLSTFHTSSNPARANTSRRIMMERNPKVDHLRHADRSARLFLVR